MQLSTKLQTIKYIFIQNKNLELSFNKNQKYTMKDKINDKYFNLIKEKYKGFEDLKGLVIYNQIGSNFTFKNICLYIFKTNFYKKNSLIFGGINNLPNKTDLFTIFKIENSKKFINSILNLIDKEKEKLSIYNIEEQKKETLNLIKKDQNKFQYIPLNITIDKYINSHIQYYKTIKQLKDFYKIINIQIFNGNINFTLLKMENIFIIKFENNDLFINEEEVYFKRKNTVIFELIKLIFSYFIKENTNNVEFDELEKYYKSNKEDYIELKRVRFNYEYLRKSIETKNKEIQRKHNLNTFLGINVNGIQCENLEPEN